LHVERSIPEVVLVLLRGEIHEELKRSRRIEQMRENRERFLYFRLLIVQSSSPDRASGY
jgi:hypothetical protein